MTHLLLGIAALAAWVSAPVADAGEPKLTGRQVMDKARRVNQPSDETVEVDMQLVPEGGRVSRRKLRLEYLKGADGLDRMLIRFSYPRRMKGTGLLTLERRSGNDDQWLYLPSLRRTRRIHADARAERFVQSDFTYEDLQPEDLDDNAYKLLRTEQVDGRRCHVVEALPRSPSGYARREIAVDAERWLPVRTLYFDAAGRRLKTQTAAGIARHGERYWRPSRIEMIDHVRRHTTVFDVKSRAIDQRIDPAHFTQRFLQSRR
jgi:outer membrane lipoprotein-sorting protein